MADDERKIIIDEDWKARAQREKEEARRKAEEEKATQETATPEAGAGAAAAPAPQAAAQSNEGDEGEEAQGPSFMALVSSLAAQCMFALGVLVPRDSQQVYVNLDEARYTIELINILRDKTQGNLTKEESDQLEATITELQQVFAARVQQAQEQAMNQSGIDPANLKGQPPQ